MFDSIRSALRRSPRAVPVPGTSAVVAGLPAVAALEVRLSDAICPGGGFPAALATPGTGERNLFGDRVLVQPPSGNRGTLAAASALALGGLRATAFLTAAEAERSRDLVARAAARQLPLVVHVVGGATPRRGLSLHGDHVAAHLLAGTGAVVLVADTVQRALDLTLLARRVAETMLVPVVVVQDDHETALSLQDALVPDDELIASYVGRSRDTVPSPTASQALVFGRERRRVPRRLDVERPMLESPFLDGAAFAGEAAGYGFVARHLAGALAEARTELSTRTGRELHAVTRHGSDRGEVVWVATGAVGECLRATLEPLRDRKVRAAALVVHQLAPFPAAALCAGLVRARHALVVDRGYAGPDGEGPLSSRIRSTLDRCAENHGADPAPHPDLPTVDPGHRPRLLPVFHEGVPRLADLVALAAERPAGPVFLGVPGRADGADHPKHEALLDALRRDDPGAMDHGLRSREPAPTVLGKNALAVEIHRRGGNGDRPLLAGLATLLHAHDGGSVRGRTEFSWDPRSEGEVDRLLHAAAGTSEPGDDLAADVVVWDAARVAARPPAAARLAEGGLFLLPAAPAEDPLADRLTPELRAALIRVNARVYVAPAPVADAPDAEPLLGAAVGMLADAGRLDLTARKARALRAADLDHLPEAEREARLDAFESGFDGVRRLDSLEEVAAEPARGTKPVPPRLRRVTVPGDRLDSPARFEDHTGALVRDHDADRLAPDPYLALGSLPPRTSCRDIVLGEDMIPAFDPDPCTGCGACWSVCPDSAITATVVAPRDMLEHALGRVRESGDSADGLRRILPKLAAGMVQAGGSGPAGPLLDAAFERATAKLPDDQKTDLAAAFARVRGELAPLPLARTEVFLDRREGERRGTGQFLTLAVDPDICRGCALCVGACEPDALTRVGRTQALVAEAVDTTFRVGSLPPASSDTLERMRAHPELHPLSAPMLDQIGDPVLTGGGAGEPGSGERLAARQILATAADRLRPARDRRIAEVEEVETELRTRIHGMLSGALPTGDLDALSEGLRSLDRPDVDLGSLAARLDGGGAGARVDRALLEAMVSAARELEDLRRRLVRGDNGLGRALLSVVGAPGGASSWMGAFPDNPFAVPVELDSTGRAVDTARALWTGQLHRALDDVRLVRHGRRLLDAPAEAVLDGGRGDAPGWADLTPGEREFVPPVFLLGTDDALGGDGLAALGDCFNEGVPLKVIAFADPHSGMGRVTGPVTPAEIPGSFHGDLGLVALAHPLVFVLQTSLSHPAFTGRGVVDAVDHPGPALVRIAAPSPWRDGYAPERTLERAADAVTTRAHPLLRRGGRMVPGPRPEPLELEENPSPHGDWAEGRRTPGHWAAEDERGRALLFRPADDDPREAVLLADYVDLPPDDRAHRAPTVAGVDVDGTWIASDAVVRFTEERLWSWRRLRRMAVAATGLSRAAHDLALEELRREHKVELETTRAAVQAEMTERLRARLRTLVQRGAPAREEA